MPSTKNARLPQWAAPLGFRWFAPALFLAVCFGNLVFVTFASLHRPNGARGFLLVLWVSCLAGGILMLLGWRALLRNAETRTAGRPISPLAANEPETLEDVNR